MSRTTTSAYARARIARCSRQFGPDAPETADARRDHAAARLEEFLTRVTAEAPPLTTEQRDRLVTLLVAPTEAVSA